jgi:hypothetical protein
MTNWECFCDKSYYGLWAVRQVGENRWGHCFHFNSKEEAEGLRDLLNELQGDVDKAKTWKARRMKKQLCVWPQEEKTNQGDNNDQR